MNIKHNLLVVGFGIIGLYSEVSQAMNLASVSLLNNTVQTFTVKKPFVFDFDGSSRVTFIGAKLNQGLTVKGKVPLGKRQYALNIRNSKGGFYEWKNIEINLAQEEFSLESLENNGVRLIKKQQQGEDVNMGDVYPRYFNELNSANTNEVQDHK